MTIDVVAASPVPRFRLSGADAGPVSLATLTVLDTESGSICWAVAPQGSVTTRDAESGAIDVRGPKSEAWDAVRVAGEKLATPGAMRVSEVLYGTTPEGLQQCVPEGKRPSPLVPGRAYVVIASGAGASTGDGASADFNVTWAV